jgi:hypothetical protein
VTRKKNAVFRPEPELGPLDDNNFREYAQSAIKSYERKRMFIDAILWRGIITLYEAALQAAKR